MMIFGILGLDFGKNIFIVTTYTAVNDPSCGCTIVDFLNDSPGGNKFGE